ncbi:hypothetical protein BGX26_004664 [Mortierella sp. AD094]|nr:hypothetical protein BGX26_004664 [Mortierella sp. AD094]
MDAKTLNWSVDGFSEQAIGSLMSRHSRIITDLRLTGTTGLTSPLSTISGTDLVRIAKVDQGNQDSCKNTEQVIVGEDWICLRLTTLHLQFDLGSKEMNIDRDTPEGEAIFQRQQRLEQYHAFRQIGRLTHLEKLYISRDASDARNERTLDLRLQANGGGLEGMAALKNLSYFNFNKTKQELSEEEIDWMIL